MKITITDVTNQDRLDIREECRNADCINCDFKLQCDMLFDSNLKAPCVYTKEEILKLKLRNEL